MNRKDYYKDWRARSHKYVMLAGAKCRSKRKSLECSITQDDFDTPTHCPVLKIPLVRHTVSGWHDDSPSLDRIDSSKGYVKGNVRVISNRANRLKCDATLEELELILDDARSRGH